MFAIRSKINSNNGTPKQKENSLTSQNFENILKRVAMQKN
jgi:hypothetical protein